MELRLDLHIHSERSPDGCMTLAEIAARARAAGLNGAAVCDHDRTLEEVPEFPDFLLIPGVEVSTEYGHLLGLFVREPIGTRKFAEAVERIHSQGGLAVLAHPFEHSRDAGRIAPIAPLLDGVEVWNSRAERKIADANSLAEAFAKAHGLRRFAGSDAHVPQEIGHGVTVVQAEACTLDAVKAALLHGGTQVQGLPEQGLVHRPEPADQTEKDQGGAGGLCQVGGLCAEVLRPGSHQKRRRNGCH